MGMKLKRLYKNMYKWLEGKYINILIVFVPDLKIVLRDWFLKPLRLKCGESE